MKSLPKKPSLEFLKNEAKALRNQHQQRDERCCALIRQHDKAYRSHSDTELFDTPFSINDAQRITARDYGFSSWTRLKKFIEGLNAPIFQGISDPAGYQKTITDSYDQRADVYHNHLLARENSLQLVAYHPAEEGESVLDLATGIGTIAFRIAEQVGPQGSVTGVDLSSGMIRKCRENLAQREFSNLTFLQADAEDVSLPRNSFDRIYCSGGLYWMLNPLSALRHWYSLLKPGGILSFTAWPDKSLIWGDGARRALGKFGIRFTVHEFTGNQRKTRQLLELAGYTDIELREVNDGEYITSEQAKQGPVLALESYAPGQYPHPIAGVPQEIMEKAQQEYEKLIDQNVTDQGVWFDRTIYYVYGKKP